jgi:xylulokinase
MILAIDCGSTNHKVAIFDETLHRLAGASKPVTYAVRNAKRVEFDPGKLWQDTVELIREACQTARIPPREIKTISLTSQANTFTLVNAAGDAVTPFFSWLDKRATKESADLTREFGKEFHQHCSFPAPAPQLQVSKLLWLARHLPRSAREGTKVMPLPSFLAWQLAGLHCTDANLSAMGGLYSLRQQGWWPEILSACSVTAEACGRVVAPGTAVTAERACAKLDFTHELQIVFAGNDQTAGAFANGIRNAGLVLTLGTALVAYRFAGAQAGPFPSGGWWGAYPCGGYYEMLARDEGCAALDWAVEQLIPGKETEFFQIATTGPSGSAFFFPQFMHTPAAWTGATDIPAKVRAVIEGISFSLRELVEGMEVNRGARETVNVIGGGSANPFWLALLANVLDRPVQRGGGDNLLGAAMMARPGIAPPSCAAKAATAPELAAAAQYEKLYRAWLSNRETSV